MNMQISEKDVLESFMDLYSMETLLDVMAQISLEKAEHIAREWQDNALAKQWMAVGMKLDHVKISKPISVISQSWKA